MRKNKWLVLVVVAAMLLAACQPKTVLVEKVVKEVVTQVVEVEKEVTKIVAGTPVVEKVVETKVVEQEVVVTATPEPTVSPYDPDAPIKIMADTTRFPVIDLFLEAFPEYKGKIEAMTDTRGVFLQKLLLYNNVGDGWPDVIFHETAALRTANTAQYDFYPADLSLWVEQDLIDEFYPGANADCTARDGKVICLRNDIAPNIFYYNVPFFEEFGYTVPTTWEEYIALGEKVAEEHPGYFIGPLDNWATSRVWYVGSECPMMNPIT